MGTRLSSRRILECKQFHLWSNTAYTISDNCTHVTEYGVQAAVNSKDLSHARRLGVCPARLPATAVSISFLAVDPSVVCKVCYFTLNKCIRRHQGDLETSVAE